MTSDAYITAFGTVLAILGGVWWIVTLKTNALEKRLDAQDDRIFFLATGKSLKEAILESKKQSGLD